MEKEKTEKIDVPQFDGWEAFYGRPRDYDGCRILSSNGKDLIPVYGCEEYIKDWPQICYRKIKPKRIVLEETGEVRQVMPGEWGEDTNDGWMFKQSITSTAKYYKIWREVKE